MELNIGRQNQISQLETYLKNVDTEVTMLLQSLQWDRKDLLEKRTMQVCQYNSDHHVPPEKIMEHEKACCLKSQGYSENDRLLPSPVNPDAKTVVKLSSEDISKIINNASRYQPLFKTGAGSSGPQPLTVDRLQSAYTSDERRAIYDAVVSRVPSCHDLSYLELLSSTGEENKDKKHKSKLEILAELRDMKRRRTKYRVAAKTRKYSDVLRDVITTQMELFNQAQNDSMNKMKNEKQKSKGVTEELNIIEDNGTKSNKDNMNKRLLSYEGSCSKLDKDTESRHSGQYKEYESRKKRHQHSDQEYSSEKYSKTHELNRSSTYRDKDDSYNKFNRYQDSSRTSRDGHRHYNDYERRKRSRGDNYYRRETKIEDETSVNAKYKRNGKSDRTVFKKASTPTKDGMSIESSSKMLNECHSLNIRRESEKKYQCEKGKLDYKSDNINERNEYSQKSGELIKPIKKENHDFYDEISDSSDDITTDYTDSSNSSERESKPFRRHSSKDKQNKFERYKRNPRISNVGGKDNRTEKEILNRDNIKLPKNIKKEPLSSSEDREDSETRVSDNRHRSYDRSHSYSYKGKQNKDYDRDVIRKRSNEGTRSGYRKDGRRYKDQSYRKF